MIIILSLSIAIITFFSALVVIRWQCLKPYNQCPLKIETFDGLNSPFHPSVIFFKNGWNGWKYWMAETPFSPKCKPYIDRNECPSIHVSNDGKNWQVPTGLTNPIINLTDEQERNLDYYSDPHLVMVGNRLECWYRLTERHGDVNNRNNVSLRRVYSIDGINWSKEEVICYLEKGHENVGLGKMVVSPALIYSDDLGYSMWFVNSEDHSGSRGISISSSNDGRTWTNSSLCNFTGKKINPWHIDIMNDKDGLLIMTIYDKHDLTLWKSKDGINWQYLITLISPSQKIGSFYRIGLYRACLIHDDANYKLFFSAYDFYHTYIGLGEFNHIGQLPSIFSETRNFSFFKFIGHLFAEEYRHIRFIIRHFITMAGSAKYEH